jgi:hypothetical protein
MVELSCIQRLAAFPIQARHLALFLLTVLTALDRRHDHGIGHLRSFFENVARSYLILQSYK